MPSYEYEILREDTGERIAAVTAIVPVDARDRVVLRTLRTPGGYELVREDTGERVGVVNIQDPGGVPKCNFGTRSDRRSLPTIRRRTVPRTVAISGSAVNERAHQGSALAGYRHLELKHGSRFKSRFTPEQIKRAHAHH